MFHGNIHWSSAVRKILLVQPSSAAAERVFSILTTSFGHLQNQSLSDYIELSLMLQYNNRQGECVSVCIVIIMFHVQNF